MIEDSGFWIFFTILFLSAYLTSEAAGRYRRSQEPKRLLFAAGALLASVGLWWSGGDLPSSVSDVIHLSNGAALLLGMGIGFIPPLVLIPFLMPLILSLFMEQPLKPLVPDDETELGTLKFLPSEGDDMTMVWEDDKAETLVKLRGDKAALYIMSCRTRPAFFFLRDRYIVLGIGTEALLPGYLNEYDEMTFYGLIDIPGDMGVFYDVHYPAPRFVEPGYFDGWSYSVRNGEIRIRRK
jgi:hypothetical protein